ncbi:SpoIIE family protein phosphatase [Streptomyces sp. NPDC058239]|uniref:SpoIIE family protein phosphatase n=1 Tax=Streptomyces sp. NPDC058239 TaxID=3346395 RepID=UPI0036E9681E
MAATDAFPEDSASVEVGPSEPGGLLDVLDVAAVVLDGAGRIALWSPQAEELFGWTAEQALGRFAAQLLVAPEHFDLVLHLFAQVMSSGESWAGVFPVRHKDGGTRLVEFRNMRLLDEHGQTYALGIATDQATLREVERDLALSVRLVAQSPIGLAVLDTDLRYVMVNPALERLNDLPAAQHIGRDVYEVLRFLDDPGAAASMMRQVLDTGRPLVNQFVVGRSPTAPAADIARSVSYYRLEDPAGRVLGVAASVVDVTEQHRAGLEAADARKRLATIARASVMVGTTLDVEQTARELADILVPELADLAAVDILDAVLDDRQPGPVSPGAPALFRALAVTAAYPTLTDADLRRIAAEPRGAALLAQAGLHAYLAVPLIARGEVLGAMDLCRARNPLPFDPDDVVLAGELAARAAVCIDNARSYQNQRRTALTLQRHLMTHQLPEPTGLEIAYRYQPAQASAEVGGDWFDAIPVAGDKTALVIGDVMGSGINAAATMGQLRTAVRTLADLDLDPAQVLLHLDHIAGGLDPGFATCIYAVYDPKCMQCLIALAGHLPPVLTRRGRPPELLDLPTGIPLGVGAAAFEQTTLQLDAGDQLLLYTDGLVETRDQPIDTRLNTLLDLLAEPQRALEATCDHLLGALRRQDDHDDVSLLISRARAHRP